MTNKKTSARLSQHEIDPAAAEKAFLTLAPVLAKIKEEELSPMRVDRKLAAVTALGVARLVNEGALHHRLITLPLSEFDHTNVHGLETAATALWHTAVVSESADAQKSDAKLPAALVSRAVEIKERMLKLVTYNFSDDPIDGPEIADIVIGSGYVDLATDLSRLAMLYAKQRNRVKVDPKHYVATDEDEARVTSQRILRALSDQQNKDGKRAALDEARAWTHMQAIYNDVVATVRWVLRKDPTAAEQFPSLYAAARPQRRPADEAPVTTEPSPIG